MKLNNIDLIAIDCNHPEEAIHALNISSKNIEFGRVILFTDSKKESFSHIDTDNVEFMRIPKIKSADEYQDFCLRLTYFLDNQYALLIQHDGFILNANLWNHKFLDYDYIGAPWTKEDGNTWCTNTRVGNGGFSLRSKKFLLYSSIFGTTNGVNEDYFLTNVGYQYAVKRGIKFADIKTAIEFSFEKPCNDLEYESFNPSNHFGFHGLNNLDIALDYVKEVEV
jgi:hypothetical protein